MSGTAINTFTNGSTEEVSFTSMQQTILNAIKSQDDFSFINFEDGNTAALGIAAGSVITVNFVQYRFDVNELFNVLNADGSVTASAAAAYGAYYIVAVPDSNGHCTCYMKSISPSNVVFNAGFGGWYEAGTQHRVFGECKKSGGGWPSERKRLYSRPENIESFIKMYPNGLEMDVRKISPIVTRGRVGTVYADTTAKDWAAGTTQLFKCRTDYRTLMEFAVTAKTYVNGIPPKGQNVDCQLVVYLLDDASGEEIGILETRVIATFSGPSSVECFRVAIDLPVGSFAIKLVTRTGITIYDHASGVLGTHTDSIYAYVRNPDGNRLGEWGAVI